MSINPFSQPEEEDQEPLDPRDDDQIECYQCEEWVPADETDENGVCLDCLEAAEDQRQLESDYRSSVL